MTAKSGSNVADEITISVGKSRVGVTVALAILFLSMARGAETSEGSSQDYRRLVATGKFESHVSAKEPDEEALKRSYAANNKSELPIVSWINHGSAKFLLYADGAVMVADPRSKSRLAGGRFSDEELQSAIVRLSLQQEFWTLDSFYKLSTWNHDPLNVVKLRLPGKQSHSVSVYGLIEPREILDRVRTNAELVRIGFLKNETVVSPPAAFVGLLRLLDTIRPKQLSPWDPGYVEILWSDYGYAPENSIVWPSGWPDFESVLVRPMSNTVITKIMIFPSEQLEQLDAFLAQRLVRGAILISGKKMSASYRWPLRGEKQWSSWNQ